MGDKRINNEIKFQNLSIDGATRAYPFSFNGSNQSKRKVLDKKLSNLQGARTTCVSVCFKLVLYSNATSTLCLRMRFLVLRSRYSNFIHPIFPRMFLYILICHK